MPGMDMTIKAGQLIVQKPADRYFGKLAFFHKSWFHSGKAPQVSKIAAIRHLPHRPEDSGACPQRSQTNKYQRRPHLLLHFLFQQGWPFCAIQSDF